MKEIATALVKAQKAFAPALKTATNPHFRSKYVDLASCVESVIDALNANGIFLFQTTSEHPDGIVCETSFLHESGERLDCGKLFFPAPKQDPQGFMSCLTYIRRASLMAATGQAPEDDDGNAASRAPRISATKTELVSPGRTNVVASVAAAINERMAADDVVGALEEFQGIVDVEEKTALWSMLDSKTRSSIKKQSELSKG
jgi:hypothetical protein